MLNTNETGLAIFDNFLIDRGLPKNNSNETKGIVTSGAVSWMNEGSNNNRGFNSSFVIDGDTVIYPGSNGKSERNTIWLRIRLMIRFLLNKDFKPKIKTQQPKITIQEYFRSIKMNCQEIEKIDDRINGYEKAIKNAEQFGQVALVEDLKSRVDVIMFESRMFSIGLIKVISEEQVVKFYKESEKGIQLSWIKNFGRIIPESLLEIKNRADELEIFDNYVIMYYDPDKKSYKETKEEEIKRKDPILFGVLKDSRKLYYIGSWEDEYCDLTLDKFIEKFGEEVISKNNISVDKF